MCKLCKAYSLLLIIKEQDTDYLHMLSGCYPNWGQE